MRTAKQFKQINAVHSRVEIYGEDKSLLMPIADKFNERATPRCDEQGNLIPVPETTVIEFTQREIKIMNKFFSLAMAPFGECMSNLDPDYDDED